MEAISSKPPAVHFKAQTPEFDPPPMEQEAELPPPAKEVRAPVYSMSATNELLEVRAVVTAIVDAVVKGNSNGSSSN